MNENMKGVNYFFKFYFILVHIWIIYFSSVFYSIEKVSEEHFVATNCQINKTLSEEIRCPIRYEINSDEEMKKLCKKDFYGIIYGKNQYGYFDQLPDWFSPIDKENVRQKGMNFSGKNLSQPMNISCYYDRLTEEHIRWSKPDPKRFLQLIVISVIALSLTIIHCFHGHSCRRRSNMILRVI